MHQQLKQLQQVVQKMDNDNEYCLRFFGQHIKRHDVKMSKYDVIRHVLQEIEHEQCHQNNIPCTEADAAITRILQSLNDRYYNNQHKYTWQSHICHFHMNLRDWLNCPMTCLTEVDEFLGKILKGD